MIIIPEMVKESLDAYATDHKPVGDFIRAVLSNDLGETISRADPQNLREIKQIVGYCQWEIPRECWGSPEAYKKWVGRT